MMQQLVARQQVSAGLDAVWSFFATPDNLDRLTPPSLRFRILSGNEEPLHSGQLIRYRIRLLPFWTTDWLTEITEVVPQRSFVDEQRSGPYRFWRHRHEFQPTGAGVEVLDTVDYDVGRGPAGDLLHRLWIRPRLEQIFTYRRQVIANLFDSNRE